MIQYSQESPVDTTCVASGTWALMTDRHVQRRFDLSTDVTATSLAKFSVRHRDSRLNGTADSAVGLEHGLGDDRTRTTTVSTTQPAASRMPGPDPARHSSCFSLAFCSRMNDT